MAKLVKSIPKLVAEAVEYSKPRLITFIKYAKVELAPPSPGEVPVAIAGIKNMIADAKAGSWKKVNVRDAWLNTLVAAEVAFWFYIGECIGKRCLVGYQV